MASNNITFNIWFFGIEDLNKVIKFATKKTRISYPRISVENITRIDRAYKNHLNYVGWDTSLVLEEKNDHIMSASELLDYIDAIAEELANTNTSDLQKILILNNFMAKNFTYNKKYIEEQDAGINNEYTQNSTGHSVRELVKNKSAVCLAYANFVAMVLNHPKLNIKTSVVESENHALNKIELDGQAYYYDFTNERNNLSVYMGKGMVKFTNLTLQLLEFAESFAYVLKRPKRRLQLVSHAEKSKARFKQIDTKVSRRLFSKYDDDLRHDGGPEISGPIGIIDDDEICEQLDLIDDIEINDPMPKTRK